jgi:hypothetical protein
MTTPIPHVTKAEPTPAKLRSPQFALALTVDVHTVAQRDPSGPGRRDEISLACRVVGAIATTFEQIGLQPGVLLPERRISTIVSMTRRGEWGAVR